VVAGSSELVGADVIVAHRLLKNEVTKRTGVEAFALITEACVTSLDLDPQSLDLIAHTERYDDVGEVRGWVRDVGARWRDLEERGFVRIDAADADIAVSATCPAPRAQVWDAITDPAKQLGWKVGATAVEMRNPFGSRDVGSRTHCVHGRQAFDQEILDWRPFTYFSYREVGPYGPFLWTIELMDDDHGTNVDIRVQLAGGRRQRALMTLGRRRLVRTLETCLVNLASQLSTANHAAPAPPPT
jgi:uncharacterized protein YndB with AHSA1/START domain